MQHTSPRRRQGFTLVEVAVIMPMAVLIIGAMIGTILYLTNVSLRTQGKSKQQVEVITSLDRMEQDVRNAMSITMVGGQLKVVALATNKDPLNTDRQLINKADCSLATSGLTPADALQYTVTYQTQPSGAPTSLIRTISVDYSASSCSTAARANVWQRNGSETFITGAKSIFFNVFLSNDGTSFTGSNVAKIELKSERMLAGRSTSFTGYMYAKSVNIR